MECNSTLAHAGAYHMVHHMAYCMVNEKPAGSHTKIIRETDGQFHNDKDEKRVRNPSSVP